MNIAEYSAIMIARIEVQEGDKMDIRVLQKELQELNEKIEPILRESGYFKTGALTKIRYDNKNLDEKFVYEKCWELLRYLGYCNDVLNYLQKPILHEGIVRVSGNGKYTIGELEINKGDVFEIFEIDESTNAYHWRTVYSDSRLNFEGKKARIRG